MNASSARRLCVVAVVLGVLSTSGAAFAQDAGDAGGQDAGVLETTQDPFPLTSDSAGITIDFRDASVEEASKFFVAIVGIKYVVDESCDDDTITIETEEPLPNVRKAVERFEEELEDAGYTVTRMEEGRRISCD
jgi:type II secretory pathway component GspD/PulD (secretin)